VVSPNINMHTIGSSSRHGKSSSTTSNAILHVLSISASVTRLRWRPPSRILVSSPDELNLIEDLHDSMMAVATAPVKGASAGGAGVLSLWSIHRPYMPLSTVQGHSDGAVTDFEWLETPQQQQQPQQDGEADAWGRASDARRHGASTETPRPEASESRMSSFGGGDLTGSARSRESLGLTEENDQLSRIWQHVISVGRDGQCIVQSFVRGKMPSRIARGAEWDSFSY
jgi:WD repeat-containing protein 24